MPARGATPPDTHRSDRRWAVRVSVGVVVVVASAGVGGLAAGALSGPAAAAAAEPAAATSYRFWTYWHQTGTAWTYAATGPSTYVPGDGSVEGWRYEVAADGAARPPRPSATFAKLCGSTVAVNGRIRIGIVLDYGTAGDARKGQHPPASRGACARVAPGASGITALQAIASIRFRDDGLICAFDGYPSTGCVDVVRTATGQPSATLTATSTATSTATPTRPPRSTERPTPTRQPTATSPPTARALPTGRGAPSRSGSPPPSGREQAVPSLPASGGGPTTSTAVVRERGIPQSRPSRRIGRLGGSTSTSSSGSTSSSARVPGAADGPGDADAAGAASAGGLVLTGSTRPGSSSPGVLTWAGITAVALIAGAAGLLARRRRGADAS